MSRTLTGLQALGLGVVVLAGLGLGVWLLFAVGSRGWYGKDALHVNVAFDKIGGVEVGTRVRIQGLDAGEVYAIAPPEEPGGPMVLRLRLKGEYRHLVRSDAQVQIASEGLMGGKVVEIAPRKPRPGEEPKPPVADGDFLVAQPVTEVADLVEKGNNVLNAVLEGDGLVPWLLKDPQAIHSFLEMMNHGTAALRQGKDALETIQQDAEALQKTWPFKDKVVNARQLLARYDCERDRRVFPADDLFEPGRAALTAQGKQRLDGLRSWLDGLKHQGSEVVVVAYADPHRGLSPQQAQDLTRQQSQTVSDYLIKQHAVQKLGTFSRRKVTPVGQGHNAPPLPERERLPPGRVEVQVFVLQGK
jgi:phospholipid/cholesterol/gamma-HCH transport system substrate-binding protein